MKDRKRRVTFHLGPEEIASLKAISREMGFPVAALIRWAVREFAKVHAKQEKP